MSSVFRSVFQVSQKLTHSIIYYTLLFRLYIIDIAYEYNSTSSFENGYIYIHCQWITFSFFPACHSSSSIATLVVVTFYIISYGIILILEIVSRHETSLFRYFFFLLLLTW